MGYYTFFFLCLCCVHRFRLLVSLCVLWYPPLMVTKLTSRIHPPAPHASRDSEIIPSLSELLVQVSKEGIEHQ